MRVFIRKVPKAISSLLIPLAITIIIVALARVRADEVAPRQPWSVPWRSLNGTLEGYDVEVRQSLSRRGLTTMVYAIGDPIIITGYRENSGDWKTMRLCDSSKNACNDITFVGDSTLVVGSTPANTYLFSPEEIQAGKTRLREAENAAKAQAFAKKDRK